ILSTVGADRTAFAIVTDTGSDVALLPAASRATAVSECGPFASDPVLHVTLYGEEVSSAPMGVVPSRNDTPTTPTLSLALAETSTLPDTLPPAGAVIETVGAIVSAVTVTRARPTALPTEFRIR